MRQTTRVCARPTFNPLFCIGFFLRTCATLWQAGPDGKGPEKQAEGDPVELSTTGVFQLPKASAAVLTVGARVACDNMAKEVTTPAAGRFPIGVAVEAAGNGLTSVAVRLDGVAMAAA